MAYTLSEAEAMGATIEELLEAFEMDAEEVWRFE